MSSGGALGCCKIKLVSLYGLLLVASLPNLDFEKVLMDFGCSDAGAEGLGGFRLALSLKAGTAVQVSLGGFEDAH